MQLRLLGPLELLGDDEAPVAIGGAKERALLAVLAVHDGRVISEDRLIDALWGDVPPRTAARTLQSYLSRLRRALATAGGGVTLDSHHGGWALRLASDAVDVSRVQALAADARACAATGDHLGAALAFADALQLWRGRPLEEFTDQPWAVLEATRLEEVHELLVEERIDAELACGRHAELVGQLEALCRTHPLRERLWGQRMLALYRSGRQAEALRVYQELRRTLGEELGIEPNPNVARLEQAILVHDPALELATPLAGAPVAARPAPLDERTRGAIPVAGALPHALATVAAARFVGRAAEIAQLQAAWEEARGGRREVVLVAGEPGIGKTTLAARVAETAAESGATVLFGRCDEESVVPFQPFIEAITQYVEAVPVEDLRQQLGAQAADLALLVPGLANRLPEAGGVERTGAENERYRGFEAAASLFAAAGHRSPLFLVLDDLHWADRPTLQLLQHLIRRAADVPLLIVGTYRDTDLVRTHPMAEVLSELRRANLVTRLPLRGLGCDDVVALVTGGQEQDQSDVELADALWSETEGSPLFLREILRHLDETGAIAQDDTGRWLARRRIDQLGIPEGVKEVIGRRLTRLSEAANGALRAGSVVGREIRLDVLERVTALSSDELLDALDEATAAGVVEEVPARVGRWAFTHALVRQALYDELSLTRRVRMHQRVGEALEALEPGDGPHLAELAFHFSQAAVAGQAENAIDYARRAGAYAMTHAAYEEAARHFAMAVEVAEDAGLGTEVRADLLLDQGAAEWRTGDARVARATFDRVVALVADADPERLAKAALGYVSGGVRHVWVEVWVVNDRAVGLLETALDKLPPGDSTLRAQVTACLAQELHFDADAEQRRARMADEAVAMARRLGDARTLAHALSCRNLASMLPDNPQGDVESATELLGIARELADRPLEAHALRQRSFGLWQLDQLSAAMRDMEAWTALAEELKDPSARAFARFNESARATLEGRFDDAERHSREAFALAQDARDPNTFGSFGVTAGLLRFLQGRNMELMSLIDPMVEAYPRAGDFFQATWPGFFVSLGLMDSAKEMLGRAEPARVPKNVFWILGVSMYALACQRLGGTAEGEAAYQLLAPYSGTNAGFSIMSMGSADLPIAWAAHAAGRVADARRHYEAAMESNRRNGWRPWLALAQIGFADVLTDADDESELTRAAAVLDEAIAITEELDMQAFGHEAYALRSRLTGTSEVPPPGEPLLRATRWDRARARLASSGRTVVARWTKNDSDEELARRFGSNLAQRALFGAISKAFQPAMAFGFSGDISFELRPHDDIDAPPDWWTITVRGMKATARRGRNDQATVVLHLPLPTFVRLVSGELHAAQALVDNLMVVDGDVFLAARLPDLFGMVEPIQLPPAEHAGDVAR